MPGHEHIGISFFGNYIGITLKYKIEKKKIKMKIFDKNIYLSMQQKICNTNIYIMLLYI